MPVTCTNYKLKCGGCPLLNQPYPDQLKHKQQLEQRLLGRFAPVSPVLGQAEPWHYRNKAIATFSTGPRGRLTCGIYAAGTHRVLPYTDCLLQDTVINQTIAAVLEAARACRWPAFEKLFRGCGQCAVRSKSSGQRSDQLRLHRRRGGRVPLQADQQGGGRMKHRESEQTQLRVSRLLNRDSVMLHAEMPSVQTALETLVELQESNGVITNGTAYYNAVCERERAGGTTAIGEGLAIPHACNAGVASLGLAALTLTRGLGWKVWALEVIHAGSRTTRCLS